MPIGLVLLALGCRREPSRDEIQAAAFDAEVVGEVWLTLAEADLASLDADPEAEDWVQGGFRYVGGGLDVERESVGIRYKGATSLDARLPKLPMKVKFDAYGGTDFGGLKKLGYGTEYGDPTFVREALAYEAVREEGLPAPRTQYVRMYVNDAYRGVYLQTEEVDDIFASAWLGHPPDEPVYTWKVSRGPLLFWGEEPDTYTSIQGNYQRDEDAEDEGRIDPVIELARTLSFASAEDLPGELKARFRVDEWIELLAIQALQVNLDSYLYSANNFFLYEEPEGGRLRMVLWDLDSSFGAFPPTASVAAKIDLPLGAPGLTADPRPLVDRVLANATWRAEYAKHLERLLEGSHDPERLVERAKALRALVEPILAEDPTPIYAVAGDPMTEDVVGLTDAVRRYPEVYPALVPLIRSRAESVRAQLAAGISAPEDVAFIEGSATVTVAAEAPEGVPAYVVVQGRAADGPWRTLGVRLVEACSACAFEFALSIPSDVALQRAVVLLDVSDDDWMDAGADRFGAQESDDWTFDVTADQIWAGEPVWVSKFGAPIDL